MFQVLVTQGTIEEKLIRHNEVDELDDEAKAPKLDAPGSRKEKDKKKAPTLEHMTKRLQGIVAQATFLPETEVQDLKHKLPHVAATLTQDFHGAFFPEPVQIRLKASGIELPEFVKPEAGSNEMDGKLDEEDILAREFKTSAPKTNSRPIHAKPNFVSIQNHEDHDEQEEKKSKRTLVIRLKTATSESETKCKQRKKVCFA